MAFLNVTNRLVANGVLSYLFNNAIGANLAYIHDNRASLFLSLHTDYPVDSTGNLVNQVHGLSVGWENFSSVEFDAPSNGAVSNNALVTFSNVSAANITHLCVSCSPDTSTAHQVLTMDFSSVASGTYRLQFEKDGVVLDVTTTLSYNDTAETVQAAIREIPGYELTDVALNDNIYTITAVGVKDPEVPTMTDDSLQDEFGGDVTLTIEEPTPFVAKAYYPIQPIELTQTKAVSNNDTVSIEAGSVVITAETL